MVDGALCSLSSFVMPDQRWLPESPVELVEVLFNIFPEYRLPPASPIQGEDPSFHSVLIDFCTDCGRLVNCASERQLSAFGHLINAVVEKGGDLENAFSTCVLEHLHQIGALQTLRPYLSKLACERTRA